MSLEYWDKLKSVPADALRKIEAGRLKGKHDISPVWRYERMTEVFGPCGIGWKYEIESVQWVDAGAEKMVFVQINLYIKDENKWSAPIPGFGGDFAIQQELKGLHTNDEALKMAVTDALGYAMQKLGVAADVYRGKADDSKYGRENHQANTNTPAKQNNHALANPAAKPEDLKYKINLGTKENPNYKMLTLYEVPDSGLPQVEWYAKHSNNEALKAAANDFILNNAERFVGAEAKTNPA